VASAATVGAMVLGVGVVSGMRSPLSDFAYSLTTRSPRPSEVMASPEATRHREWRPVRAGLSALFRAVPELRPRIEKVLWRAFYEANSLRRSELAGALTNYGYVPEDEPRESPSVSTRDPGERADRYGRRLYDAVAGAVPLSGKDVLEVGCGRGGGTAYVFERFAPRSLTGLDLARSAIRSASRRYGRPGLRFVAGDAERLPLADGSFDVILSVESSHCYPEMGRFLGEARRVLRPGGVMLLADFRPTQGKSSADQVLPDDVDTLRRQLSDAGFRTVEEEEVTAGVVRALRLKTPDVRARIARRVPKPLRGYVLEFAAVEGSGIYQGFADGGLTYLRFVLEATGSPRRSSARIDG
jgi:SAM-dependent methyltransferase